MRLFQPDQNLDRQVGLHGRDGGDPRGHRRRADVAFARFVPDDVELPQLALADRVVVAEAGQPGPDDNRPLGKQPQPGFDQHLLLIGRVEGLDQQVGFAEQRGDVGRLDPDGPDLVFRERIHTPQVLGQGFDLGPSDAPSFIPHGEWQFSNWQYTGSKNIVTSGNTLYIHVAPDTPTYRIMARYISNLS